MGSGTMELPQINLVMQAEQWKSRLVKEEEAYAKGREIRKKETDAKIKDSRERWQSRTGRASVTSRPPTSISSVYFDSRRPDSQQSVKDGSRCVVIVICLTNLSAVCRPHPQCP